jgi:hypothetical protein
MPARQLVEEFLFNLREKSSCRFSADAGSGIALFNSWLIVAGFGALATVGPGIRVNGAVSVSLSLIGRRAHDDFLVMWKRAWPGGSHSIQAATSPLFQRNPAPESGAWITPHRCSPVSDLLLPWREPAPPDLGHLGAYWSGPTLDFVPFDVKQRQDLRDMFRFAQSIPVAARIAAERP